jgi:hypothetical protein
MRLTSVFGPTLLVLCSLAGCASGPVSKDAMLTYETKPEGAMLFEGALALGAAPQSRTYKHDGKAAAIKTPEVTAVWPSGAKETYYTLVPPGADLVATIERPKSAPNLQADLDNAKKFVAAKSADARRLKEENARDMARNSERCKNQQTKGGAVIDDC